MTYRLYVADPGLKTWNGHHAASLGALGLACGKERVEFFCHRSPERMLQAEAMRLGVRVTPLFCRFFYEAFESSGTIVELNEYINSLARDYMRLLDHLGRTGSAGLVLHHTMDWPHLVALGIANACQPGSSLPLTHLVFLMFNPGMDHAAQMLDQRRFLNYRVALARLAKQHNVRLFASGREHATAYSALAPDHRPFPVHPSFLCHGNSVEKCEHALSAKCLRLPLKGSKLILYLGDAKAEKGFCKLPDLIHMLSPYLDERSEVIIQYNLVDALASDDLLAVAGTLRAMSGADRRIRILPSFLSDRELMDLISRSSLVVFSYDPQAYAHKSSGILWQVCCCRVPVVLIGESWLSREARRLHPRYRVYGALHEWHSELEIHGCVEFEPNPADEVYRDMLFSSFDGFLSQQWMECLSAENSGQSPHNGRIRMSALRKALVIDVAIPDHGVSGGCYAAVQEIRLLHALGFGITFATPGGWSTSDGEAMPEMQCVETLCRESVVEVLKERGPEFDLIYVTRYFVAKPLITMARTFAPQAKLVLNIADLHFLRELRQASVEQCEAAMRRAETVREQELAVLEQVDLVLSYTDIEKAVIESHLGDRVRVARCPWVEDVCSEAVAYSPRRDVAFLGAYSHAPNVDAVVWFVEQVMPLLREELPGVRFRVYGAHVPPELERLACNDVLIEGFVEDVSQAYDSCRVFVAPLRYGSGLKAKVAAALARGTPCVLSPIAAEGFFSDNDPAANIVESPEEWAVAIKALYADGEYWNAASRAALNYAARRFHFDEGVRRMSGILRALIAGLAP